MMVWGRTGPKAQRELGAGRRADQSAPLTVLKVPLMLPPSDVTMPMQATMMRATITAYSTAVGPSSLTRNRWMRPLSVVMVSLAGSLVTLHGHVGEAPVRRG